MTSSIERPAASCPSTALTVTRVPRMHGNPCIRSGSMEIRSKLMDQAYVTGLWRGPAIHGPQTQRPWKLPYRRPQSHSRPKHGRAPLARPSSCRRQPSPSCLAYAAEAPVDHSQGARTGSPADLARRRTLHHLVLTQRDANIFTAGGAPQAHADPRRGADQPVSKADTRRRPGSLQRHPDLHDPPTSGAVLRDHAC